MAKHFNLIGGKLLAGDGTKLRAQNSKKNNFNQKKIDRHIAYIDRKLSEYENALVENDGDPKERIQQEIKRQSDRKKEYENIENQIKETGQPQISTSDPDSRQMTIRNNITEVAYNLQTTVDAENNIPIDYKLTMNNDSKAMGNMLQRAKTILRSNQFTALYDKGYHTGFEFQIADRLGIETIVAIPGAAAQAPNPAYNVANFKYNKLEDYYTCPQNQKLSTNGRLHKARTYLFKRYTTKACANCKAKDQCSKAKCGKAIQRSEHQDLIDKNRQRVQQNQSYYKRRQAIVEHPYGTIKRQWGFNHIMTKKGIERASTDVDLIMTAYNLRRIINIIGVKTLIKWATQQLSCFLELMVLLKLKVVQIRTLIQFLNNRIFNSYVSLKPLYLNLNYAV